MEDIFSVKNQIFANMHGETFWAFEDIGHCFEFSPVGSNSFAVFDFICKQDNGGTKQLQSMDDIINASFLEINDHFSDIFDDWDWS